MNHEPSTIRPSGPCCDICAGEVKNIDATQDAQILMSAIARTGERFGINHIVAVVTGDDSDRIRQLGHDQIKTYGAGKDRDKRHWRLVIDNLLAQGLILQTTGDYPILQLQPASREVLFGGRQVQVLKTKILKGKRPKRPAATVAGPYNEDLFEQLRNLRKELASEQGVPPYVIFTDRTLHEMARFFPATEVNLLQLTGVGEKRYERYGQRFMDAIATFREAHPDVQPDAAMAAHSDIVPVDRPAASRKGAVPTYVEDARKKHARAYEKWSDEEDERLRQSWAQQSSSSEATASTSARIKDLAADFGRKPGAIRSRLKKLGLVEQPAENTSDFV